MSSKGFGTQKLWSKGSIAVPQGKEETMEHQPNPVGTDESTGKGAFEAPASVETPTPKRSRKRWPIAVAVVAVVLVVAGVGFTVWHSQPTFCNAI